MTKSWKTTLLGIVGALLFVVGNTATQRAQNPNAPAFTFGNIAPAAVIAAIGAAARDHDK
jgi:lipopolysaccharide export LptBFGC system permease protein LptF